MRRHFHWLDTLRALAMLAVVGSHFRNALFPAWADVSHGIGASVFYALTMWGHTAVVMFFVLSGFLVGGRAVEACREGRFRLGEYALARVVRIGLPLLGACSLAVFVFSLIGIPIPWRTIFGNLFCLQGLACETLLGPWWALSVEVWFYVFGGAALGIFALQGWRRIVSAVVCTVMIGVFVHVGVENLVVWIIGAVAYLMMPKKKSLVRLCVALVAVGLALGRLMRGQLPDIVLAVAFCLLVREVPLWEPQSALVRVVERCFDWLAKFSYTTYLLHMLVMVVLMNCLFTAGVNVVMKTDLSYFNISGKPFLSAFTDVSGMSFGWYMVAVLTAFAASYLMWWLVERNTGKVLKWLKERL